jgi:hypothetical protein
VFNAETYPFSRKLPGKQKFLQKQKFLRKRKFAHYLIIFAFRENGKTVFVSTLGFAVWSKDFPSGLESIVWQSLKFHFPQFISSERSKVA